jgi:hypothetical protein
MMILHKINIAITNTSKLYPLSPISKQNQFNSTQQIPIHLFKNTKQFDVVVIEIREIIKAGVNNELSLSFSIYETFLLFDNLTKNA